MTTELNIDELRHNCDLPPVQDIDIIECSPDVAKVGAQWKCPECRQNWDVISPQGETHFKWKRYGLPSLKWRLAERARIRAVMDSVR